MKTRRSKNQENQEPGNPGTRITRRPGQDTRNQELLVTRKTWSNPGKLPGNCQEARSTWDRKIFLEFFLDKENQEAFQEKTRTYPGKRKTRSTRKTRNQDQELLVPGNCQENQE